MGIQTINTTEDSVNQFMVFSHLSIMPICQFTTLVQTKITTLRWIPLKFAANTHCPQMMNPAHFGDPLASVLLVGFQQSCKILTHLLEIIVKLTLCKHSWSPKHESYWLG